LGEKQPGTIQFILQNVDGIPTHEDGNIKLDSLKQFANENQADIITLTELNTAWDELPYKNRLPRKTRGWWEASHWSILHNKQERQTWHKLLARRYSYSCTQCVGTSCYETRG